MDIPGGQYFFLREIKTIGQQAAHFPVGLGELFQRKEWERTREKERAAQLPLQLFYEGI